MKVGLFFGSFNPIHTGHLIIANTVLNALPVSKIWFVVSPQNPLKQNNILLLADKRLELVKAAIENDDRPEVSDAEFELPIPSFTIDSIYYFEQKFPENEFYIIMGSDSFLQLPKWKDHERILQKNLVVFERPGFTQPDNLPSNIQTINSPLLNISATEIRKLIEKQKSIKYLVTDKVLQIIDSQGYYK